MISLVIMKLNLGIPFTWGVVLIIPAGIIGGMINPRYSCLSYSICIVYIINFILKGIGIVRSDLMPYDSLVILIGALHFAEGILTCIYGSKDEQYVIDYKRNKIAGGYQTYRRWYMPLLFFSVQGIYVPILAVIIYADETFTMTAKQKAKVMGSLIGGYGLLIASLGILSKQQVIPIPIAILAATIFHDTLFTVNDYIESKVSQSTPKGIKIIETTNSTIFNNPFQKGDRLLTINGELIKDYVQYEEIIKQPIEDYRVQIQKRDGKIQTIYCNTTLLRRAELILQVDDIVEKKNPHHKFIKSQKIDLK